MLNIKKANHGKERKLDKIDICRFSFSSLFFVAMTNDTH